MKKLALIVPLTGLILLFTGCVKQPKFNRQKLNDLKNSTNFDTRVEQDNVKVGIKVISSYDCKKIFDRDLHANSIYPVIFNIENGSQNSYLFTKKSIPGLQVMDIDRVYKVLEKRFFNDGVKRFAQSNMRPIAIIATALGLVSLPIIVAAASSSTTAAIAVETILMATLIVTTPYLIIPLLFLNPFSVAIIAFTPMAIFWNISKRAVNKDMKNFLPGL